MCCYCCFLFSVLPPVLSVAQVGAHAMAVCETLARRIAAAGGAALLVDYGRNEPYTNSLTAIRAHAGAARRRCIEWFALMQQYCFTVSGISMLYQGSR
jgi:SAM-dependent MidA family methyltransferase